MGDWIEWGPVRVLLLAFCVCMSFGAVLAADERDDPIVFRSDAQQTQWVGERISLSLKDADLVEVLRSFAQLGCLNLIIDPAVTGKVTVELHDVPWDHALSVILKTHRLGAELDGRVLAVGSRR